MASWPTLAVGRVADRRRRQAGGLDLDDGQVGEGVDAVDRAVELAPVLQRDRERLAPLDDVLVGDDPAVRVEDDARADARFGDRRTGRWGRPRRPDRDRHDGRADLRGGARDRGGLVDGDAARAGSGLASRGRRARRPRPAIEGPRGGQEPRTCRASRGWPRRKRCGEDDAHDAARVRRAWSRARPATRRRPARTSGRASAARRSRRRPRRRPGPRGRGARRPASRPTDRVRPSRQRGRAPATSAPRRRPVAAANPVAASGLGSPVGVVAAAAGQPSCGRSGRPPAVAGRPAVWRASRVGSKGPVMKSCCSGSGDRAAG